MTDRTQAAGLQVATGLYRFIEDEALPAAGIGVTGPAFWAGVAQIIADLTPVNQALLRRRDELQAAIDSWHRANAGQPHDAAKYRAFLEEIGYLVPSPGRSTGPTRFPRPTALPGRGPTTRCAASGWSRRCGASSTRRRPSTARRTGT
jgi:malate synthase